MLRMFLGLILVVAAWAQAAANRPTFEVASVRPAKPGKFGGGFDGGPGTKDPGRFAATNVVDKTGLNDFTLYFRPANGPPPGPNDDAPSLEQALQQQLGLKLVPSKASIDVLVIDRADKTPTEN